MQKKPQLIGNFLQARNAKTKSMILEARQISQLNIIVNQLLDHQLGEHVYASSVKRDQLTLVVDSSVWATRLRYMQNEIIDGLQKFTISDHVNSIIIKVKPTAFRPKPKPKKIPKSKMTISLSSATQMRDELDTISDTSLKDALTRLLRHAK